MTITIKTHDCPKREPGPPVQRARAVATYLGFVRGFGWYLDLSWPDDPDRVEDIDSVRVCFCPWCGVELATLQPVPRPELAEPPQAMAPAHPQMPACNCGKGYYAAPELHSPDCEWKKAGDDAEFTRRILEDRALEGRKVKTTVLEALQVQIDRVRNHVLPATLVGSQVHYAEKHIALAERAIADRDAKECERLTALLAGLA